MQFWDTYYDWSVDNAVESEELVEDDCLSDEQYCSNDEEEYAEDVTDATYNEGYEYEGMYDYNYLESNQYDEGSLTCDTCSRNFFDLDSYEKHISEHMTCGIDGCTFTAHQKVVEKHITMQHSSGLYDKIRNVSTPEDIKKWIEERERKYPSKENIEKRRLQQEKLLERGERLTPSKNRFGRQDRTRLQKHQKSAKNANIKERKKRNNKPRQKKESLIDAKSDWNGPMFPFKGTSSLFVKEEKVDDDFDDTEWAEEKCVKTNPNNKIVLNNALGALMGAYNSSDESDTEADVTRLNANSSDVTTKEEIKVERNDSDNETPVEESVKLQPPDEIIKKENADEMTCNERKKVKRSRKRPKKETKAKPIVKDVPFLQCKFKKRKKTLLEGLLGKDIRHERNVILQCVRYVVQNNFFQS